MPNNIRMQNYYSGLNLISDKDLIIYLFLGHFDPLAYEFSNFKPKVHIQTSVTKNSFTNLKNYQHHSHQQNICFRIRYYKIKIAIKNSWIYTSTIQKIVPKAMAILRKRIAARKQIKMKLEIEEEIEGKQCINMCSRDTLQNGKNGCCENVKENTYILYKI